MAPGFLKLSWPVASGDAFTTALGAHRRSDKAYKGGPWRWPTALDRLFAIQPPMPQPKTLLEVLLISAHVAAADYSAFSEAISFRLRGSPRSRHCQLRAST
jgi:hypothetical protein